NNRFMFAEQLTNAPRSIVLIDDLTEPHAWEEGVPEVATDGGKPKHLLSKIYDHDWTVGLLYLMCDIVCWVSLYGLAGYVCRDRFFVNPFEFVLVDLVTLAVLLQALYIIGGYNRYTELRSLTYSAEHIPPLAATAATTSLFVSHAEHSPPPINQRRG